MKLRQAFAIAGTVATFIVATGIGIHWAVQPMNSESQKSAVEVAATPKAGSPKPSPVAPDVVVPESTNTASGQQSAPRSDHQPAGNATLGTEYSRPTQTPAQATQEYVYEKPTCSDLARDSTKASVVSGYRMHTSQHQNQIHAYRSNLSIGMSGYSQTGLDTMIQNQKAMIENFLTNAIAEGNVRLNEHTVCTPIVRAEFGF